MSCLPPHKLCAKTGTAWERTSSRTVARKIPGKLSERQKARTLRASFKEDWQHFICSEFEDVTEVAYEFGCDSDTARAWWNGDNAPQGPFVRWAFWKWPERAAAHLLKGIQT